MRYVSILLILLLTAGAFCILKDNTPPKKEKISINIKGSDTMTVLLDSLAEEFMKNNPNIEIFVESCKSSEGIDGLLNKTTDIAAASRSINNKELKSADERSLDIKEHPIARDAVLIIINQANNIKAISLDDIKKIFTGAYTSWGEVGGSNIPVTVYNHSADSGSYLFFKENVLKMNNFTETAKTMDKPADIINSILNDPGGISYIGCQYYFITSDEVKAIGIKNKNNPGNIMPSKENIIKGLYPLSRILYLYTTGETSQTINSFVDFCTGSEGKKVVTENEIIPF